MLKPLVLAGLLLGAALVPTARAQEKFPSKPIVLICGFAAGGAGDIMTRFIADYVKEKYGVTTSVEFKTGAGATLAAAFIARTKPDGYTLAFNTVSPMAVGPHLTPVAYDPLKDFTYVVQHTASPMPVYVKVDSPFKDWQALIDHAKANPGKLRWGTAGPRGTAHILGEAAFRHLKLQTVFVPFKGGSEAIVALLGNHIEAVISTDYGPQLDAGTVRLLAETGPSPAAGHDHIPTFKSLGYPLSFGTTYGLIGAAGMPAEVIAWWDAAIKEMMTSPKYAELMKTLRTVPAYLPSKEYTAVMADAYTLFGEAIKDMGMNKQ